MARPGVYDSNTLAGIIQSLGGRVVPANTLQFDLPLSEVRNVIPRLNELGVGCRKVAERIEDNPTKLFSPQSVATLEVFKRSAQELEELPESYFTRL